MVKKQRILFICSMGAAIIGTCSFIAAQPSFDLIPVGIANPVGIAFLLASVLLWTVFGFWAAKEE